jgi:RNA polymerase sigma-70 factor, ECF subfamily
LAKSRCESELDLIVKNAQNGDKRALTELYEQYKPTISRYLYFRMGEKQLAEDTTTEVFIKVIKNIHRYRSNNSPFQAWLFSIARNLAIDYFRGHKTRLQIEISDTLVVEHEKTEAIVERNMTFQQLHAALVKLTPDQCDVIVMRFLAEMPIHEVSLTLNKTEGAVKALQVRGLQALARMKVLKEIYD